MEQDIKDRGKYVRDLWGGNIVQTTETKSEKMSHTELSNVQRANVQVRIGNFSVLKLSILLLVPSPDSLFLFGSKRVYEGSEIELQCLGGPSYLGN